jgi:hypothetical protein
MIGRTKPRIRGRQLSAELHRCWLLAGVIACTAAIAGPAPPAPSAGTPPPPAPSSQDPPDDEFIEFLGSDDVGDTAWWEFLKKVPPRGGNPPPPPPQEAKQ